MSTPTEPDADRIARRYPPPRLHRRAWLPVALVLALVFGTWLVRSAWYWANPEVSAAVVAFDVVSDTSMTVTLTIQRPDPSVAAVCTVSADAVTFDTVGELPVAIEPGSEVLTRKVVQLRTFKRATTATVRSCVRT